MCVHSTPSDLLASVMRVSLLRYAEVAEISSDLVDKSKQIRWHARQLNMQRWLRSYAPFVGIVLIVLLVSYYKFFM